MNEIARLIDKIIPYPADKERRDGFSNEDLIDNLPPEIKPLVEDGLLTKLNEHPEDLLIIDTLGYLKSKKAIEPLTKLFNESKNDSAKVLISVNLYNITNDRKWIGTACEAFSKIKELPMNYFYNRCALFTCFYQLAKLRENETNQLIMHFFDFKDEDGIVSYNAKRAIELSNVPALDKHDYLIPKKLNAAYAWIFPLIYWLVTAAIVVTKIDLGRLGNLVYGLAELALLIVAIYIGAVVLLNRQNNYWRKEKIHAVTGLIFVGLTFLVIILAMLLG